MVATEKSTRTDATHQHWGLVFLVQVGKQHNQSSLKAFWQESELLTYHLSKPSQVDNPQLIMSEIWSPQKQKSILDRKRCCPRPNINFIPLNQLFPHNPSKSLSLVSHTILPVGEKYPPQGCLFELLVSVVIWMRMAPLESYLRMLGPELLELFGKHYEMCPHWRRCYMVKFLGGFKSLCHLRLALSLYW